MTNKHLQPARPAPMPQQAMQRGIVCRQHLIVPSPPLARLHVLGFVQLLSNIRAQLHK